MQTSVEELVSRQIDVSQTLVKLSIKCADVQEKMGHRLKAAVAEGDTQAAIDTRYAM